MNQKEISRLEVIKRIMERKLRQTEASEKLEISYRQTKRLVRAYKTFGESGLLSKKRGHSSNRKFSEQIKQETKSLICENYIDFGPKFASEKLEEKHNIRISRETLRKWMIEWDIWKTKRRRKIQIHQQRRRRSCFGELVQIDGSPHAWFEDRGKPCCLIVFIDDATSKIVSLQFFPVENTRAYFESCKQHIKKHGRPMFYYSDKHSIFRVNHKEALSGTGETQFGRAMRELGIQVINANSPQAKGRVERHNRTLQDRLVKELRLRNISDIATANRFLETFTDEYNKKFGKMPANNVDMHRKDVSNEDLDSILVEKHLRKLSKNLEINFEGKIYQIILEKGQIGYGLRHAQVTLYRDANSEIKIWYRNRFLSFKEFKRSNEPSKIVSSKEIDAFLDNIRATTFNGNITTSQSENI